MESLEIEDQPRAMESLSLSTTAVGLAVGSLVLCANFQFGLQTGWVSMMSMPAALLGFAWFKMVRSGITPQENVYVQSLAVAVGTGPLSFGFVGAIPAIEMLITDEEGKIHLAVPQLLLWSAAISFVGIFTAVLLRNYIISKREMTFPSGRAAAALIGVLHDVPVESEELPVTISEHSNDTTYYRNIVALIVTFFVSSAYTGVSRLIPILRKLPIFGSFAASFMWTFEPSPAYIGQGIIMGLPTTASMLGGAILGWAILGPFARSQGWAPGPIGDWQTGAQGWIMWVSLAIMVADTSVSFIILVGSWIIDAVRRTRWSKIPQNVIRSGRSLSEPPRPPHDIEDAADQRKLGTYGLIVTAIICVVTVRLLLGVPLLELTTAVAISPFLALLGVRALGETDLNPVSSIAKLTQLGFGMAMRGRPQAILLNIIAGAITEAGAQQAGDLMQDYKTGSLLGAATTPQTVGMALGTLWSSILSAIIYTLYKAVYEIPGDEYRIPTAYIWADCARLMTGEGLPPYAGPISLAFGGIFAILAVIKHFTQSPWVPSGVGVGIGMYNVPSFTLARFLGGVVSSVYKNYFTEPGDSVYLVILSSGLILGEGIVSVLALFVTAVF